MPSFRPARLLLLALLTVGLAACGRPNPPSVGGPAPELQLSTLDGKTYRLADDPNRVVILDFFATWCGPCRANMPRLQALAAWAADNRMPVTVYAVNIGESPELVTAMWKQDNLTIPVLLDPDGVVASRFNVDYIPHLVVIVDRKIADVHTGASDSLDKDVRQTIETALAQPAPTSAPAANH